MTESKYHFVFDAKCPKCGWNEQGVEDNAIWKYCNYCGSKLIITNKGITS